MKRTLSLFFLLILLLSPRLVLAQIQSELATPPNGNSERAEVSQWIGLVKITIAYHGPNLHGGGGVDRTGHIWGELVNYGLFDDGLGPSTAKPWRAGANETTSISFSHDVKIAGQEIKAGKYGLFLELAKDGPSTWIFSTNAAGWGSFQYDPKEDVLRIPTTPQSAPHTEYLTYGFDDRKADSAVAYLQWEDKRIPFRIEVPNINDLYIAQMRKDLLGWAGFNYQNYQTAAQFCADNKINLDEALVWADKAINVPFRGATKGSADFSTFQTKAAVLTALNRREEADALMTKAFALPGADLMSVHFYGMSVLSAARPEKALEIFKLNQQKHPEEEFWTYMALARAYTALNDKPNAIKNWEVALANVPANRKHQIPTYQRALQQLKESSLQK